MWPFRTAPVRSPRLLIDHADDGYLRDLFHRWKRGDSPALEEILQSFRPVLWKVIEEHLARLGVRTRTPEDVLHDLFLSLSSSPMPDPHHASRGEPPGPLRTTAARPGELPAADLR